ncbi:MAG: hypothetical protein CMP18_00050 [Rickettsiales bacterium]|nr:hypothetical protein [Rickettsiales bacterium]
MHKFSQSISNLSHAINILDRAIETKIRRNKNLIKYNEIKDNNQKTQNILKEIEKDLDKIEKLLT